MCCGVRGLAEMARAVAVKVSSTVIDKVIVKVLGSYQTKILGVTG